MTPTYDKIHVGFKFDGIFLNADDLKELAYSYIKEGELFQQEIGNFLLDWLDNKNYILTNTSGSTGKPKTIKIKKQAMVNSAIATGDFFKLKPKDKALLCLPAKAISGRMMLVRAMILGLELDVIKPKTFIEINPSKHYDLVALTPMQLFNNLKKVENVKTVIIGGSPVNKSLLKAIQNLDSEVYETYGMTETVSHIAVKKLNKLGSKVSNEVFRTLPNVKIALNEKNCLIINAPHLSDKTLVTNDIVKIHDEKSFEWLGRYDNVINSGGIKLYPEIIEKKLDSKIENRFLITSIPNEEFGEKLILLIESEPYKVSNSIFDELDKFEKPKEVHFIPKFAETAFGKIQREKTAALLKS